MFTKPHKFVDACVFLRTLQRRRLTLPARPHSRGSWADASRMQVLKCGSECCFTPLTAHWPRPRQWSPACSKVTCTLLSCERCERRESPRFHGGPTRHGCGRGSRDPHTQPHYRLPASAGTRRRFVCPFPATSSGETCSCDGSGARVACAVFECARFLLGYSRNSIAEPRPGSHRTAP